MLPPRSTFHLLLAGFALSIVFCLIGCSSGAEDTDDDGVPNRADQCARTPAGRPVDPRGCSDVVQALARATEALLSDQSFAVGDVWVVQQLLRLRPDAGLERLAEWWIAELAPSPFLRQIDPQAPHALLPPDPGRGIRRFYHYVLAPFGHPEPRAISFLEGFLQHQASEYVLTHQLLAIVWAEEQGLALPASVLGAKSELLGRIAEEHAVDTQFSDLFAERSALLIHYSEPEAGTASSWIDTLLQAQRDDGSWQDLDPSPLEFDGERSPAVHSRAHTTVWSAFALTSFLERFAGGPAVVGSRR